MAPARQRRRTFGRRARGAPLSVVAAVGAAAAATVAAGAAPRPPPAAVRRTVAAPPSASAASPPPGLPLLWRQAPTAGPTGTDAGEEDACDGRGRFGALALLLCVPLLVSAVAGLAAVTGRHTMPASGRLAAALRLGDGAVGPPALKSAVAGFPLLIVSLLKILTDVGEEETGLDAILGASVFNVLVMPALAALLRPGGLRLDWRPLVRDTVLYMGLLAVLIALLALANCDCVRWWEGLVLLLLYVGILVLRIVAGMPVVVRAVKAAFPTPRHVPGGGHVLQRGAEGRSEELEAVPPGLEAAVVPPPCPQPQASACPLPGRDECASPPWWPSASVTDAGASADGLIPAAWRPGAPNGEAWYPCEPPPVCPAPSVTAAGVEDADAAAAPYATATAATDVMDGPTSASWRVDGDATPCGRRTFLGVPRPTGAASTALFPFLFPWLLAFRLTVPSAAGRRWPATLVAAILWTLAAIAAIVYTTEWVRCALGSSGLQLPFKVIDLTLLAAAASVTDVVEALGERSDDAAVAHVLGVNLFDAGVGVGVAWLIGVLVVGRPLRVSSDSLSEPSLPLLLLFGANGVALAVLGVSRWRVGRLQAGVLLGLYSLFVVLVFVVGILKAD